MREFTGPPWLKQNCDITGRRLPHRAYTVGCQSLYCEARMESNSQPTSTRRMLVERGRWSWFDTICMDSGSPPWELCPSQITPHHLVCNLFLSASCQCLRLSTELAEHKETSRTQVSHWIVIIHCHPQLDWSMKELCSPLSMVWVLHLNNSSINNDIEHIDTTIIECSLEIISDTSMRQIDLISSKVRKWRRHQKNSPSKYTV